MENGLPGALARVQAAHERADALKKSKRAASSRKDQRQITIKIDAGTLQAVEARAHRAGTPRNAYIHEMILQGMAATISPPEVAAPLLLVSFVCSSGWTSRIFSPAQLERALPQLEELDFPLLVSEYHPDDAKATASNAQAATCYTPEYQAALLMRLATEFGVDTAPAAELSGQALTHWIDAAEQAVFEKEFTEFQAQAAAFKAQFTKN